MPTKAKFVKVGARRFDVVDDRVRYNQVCVEEQRALFGHTNFTSLTITLDPSQAADQRADTLLHEVLHCITDITGLAAEWGTEKDEAVVRRITPVLLAVLRDNPQLLTEIL